MAFSIAFCASAWLLDPPDELEGLACVQLCCVACLCLQGYQMVGMYTVEYIIENGGLRKAKDPCAVRAIGRLASIPKEEGGSLTPGKRAGYSLVGNGIRCDFRMKSNSITLMLLRRCMNGAETL